MIMTMINIAPLKQSILVTVIEQDNLERMKTADPITMESERAGGYLPAPDYPQNFSLLIAYEEDQDELYRMAKTGGVEFLSWLERGRKFIKGVDGKRQVFRIPQEPTDAN